MNAQASQGLSFLESRIEEMNGSSINYVDIHSADESAFLAGTYGFGNGLKTGAKANVNGISSAVTSTFTLGHVDTFEPWTVYEDDINGGYGTAVRFAQGGGQLLLIVAPTGVAGLVAREGRMGKAAIYTGYDLRTVDTLSNAHDYGESLYSISQHGFTVDNSAQLALSTAGLGFDVNDGVKMLDNAGYTVRISGFASGLPLDIGKKVPNPSQYRPTENSPAIPGSDYHPDAVAARQSQWRSHYANKIIHSEAASPGYDIRILPQKAPFPLNGHDVFTNGKTFITQDIGSDPTHSAHNGV